MLKAWSRSKTLVKDRVASYMNFALVHWELATRPAADSTVTHLMIYSPTCVDSFLLRSHMRMPHRQANRQLEGWGWGCEDRNGEDFVYTYMNTSLRQ